ncbi:MAG: thiolase family protein [Cystobacterineae bacterium]|nr:thiolase family protein [Cystobacterineae bacterium]
MPQRVVIAATARTPFARALCGELKDMRPDELAARALQEAWARVGGLPPQHIEALVVGCAMPEAEQGMNVARIAGLRAGFPECVPAMTLSRLCASGLDSIAHAALGIALGKMEVAIAGGLESMSRLPLGGSPLYTHPTLMQTLPKAYISMGAAADNMAAQFNISRKQQDAFAFESQRRAIQAQKAGYPQEELFPVPLSGVDPKGGVHPRVLGEDTTPRADTTLEGLASLKPSFHAQGTVTEGNTAPLTDGAAAAVLMSEAKAQTLGLRPLGYFVDHVCLGLPPALMGAGPVPAIHKLLERHKLSTADIDLFEINETFAVQTLYCQRELNLDAAKLNPNGGSLAWGHPLGATGIRLVGTALRQLARTGGRRAIIALCIGGGMGAAALLERSN